MPVRMVPANSIQIVKLKYQYGNDKRNTNEERIGKRHEGEQESGRLQQPAKEGEREVVTLFKRGKFMSHAGLELDFKIECDALTDEDIECVAEYILSKTDFRFIVQGVPRGGNRLAEALEKCAGLDDCPIPEAPFNMMIVDDVLTTGMSMEKAKAEQPAQVHPDDVVGWVIFARSKTPDWVNAVFSLHPDRKT